MFRLYMGNHYFHFVCWLFVVMPILSFPLISKDDGWELMVPPKIIPSKAISVEVDDTVVVNADIFYYSPRMENKTYPYWEELGQRDNYLGTTDRDNRCKIVIPDTCEQDAKLIFRAIGYEPLDIAINSIQNENSIAVQLTPHIYNCTILLTKVEYPFNPRQTFLKPIITDETETQTQIYYADRSPVYYKNGNRAFNESQQIHPNYYPKLLYVCIANYSLKDIYKELKKGEKCTILLYVNRLGMVDAIEVEEFPNKKKQYKIRQEMQNSRWRFSLDQTDNSFQYRVHFVFH
ncbi:MAG: hypothetical protein FWF52_07390 [Candidatus Azobacteroides sp.]|nr:hypothetical protein [Candidatus Azobacteroides sp.]